MGKKQLVSIVGVDGCGKTTQSRHIVSRLKENDIQAFYWKSPSFDWVRDMINVAGDDQNGGDVYTDALLFAGAHRMEQYLLRQIFTKESIHSRFEKDKGVQQILSGQSLPADVIVGQRGIVDFYSFLLTEGMSEEKITNLLNANEMWKGHKYRPGEFITPDKIIYLECSPEIAMSRIPREDKWEEVPFLQRLVKTYEELFTKPPEILKDIPIIRLNAEPSIEEVKKLIDREVIPYILKD